MPEISIPSTAGHALELLNLRRNYRADVLSMIAANSHVAFYGCGTILAGIIDTWKTHVGRKIDFCCDSNPTKWGQSFEGIPCISPDDLKKIKDNTAVFVTVGDFEPVLEFLNLESFPYVHLIYKYDLASSEYLAQADLPAVAENLEATREILADSRSREVFDTILHRLLDNTFPPGPMAHVCEGNQYFPPDIIRLQDDEVFVDAGAYNGDSITEFVSRSRGKFQAIHGFELDAINFQSLQLTAVGLPHSDRISLHPIGLWDSRMEINYSVEKSQSTIGAGDARGTVDRLDDVLAGQRITFLKMDIEGAEGHALSGAQNLIRTNSPTLAICVYHHFKDLWEIPLAIRKIQPSYKIFLRHHTKLELETVCYAIPDGVC